MRTDPPLPGEDMRSIANILFVKPGLVPGIHVFTVSFHKKTWMAGINPAMTRKMS
jgi:hypothetical protein